MNRWIPIAVAILSAVFISFGSLLLKRASDKLSIYYGFGGLCLYGISFILVLFALRYANLTVIYAVGALSYVIVLYLSVRYLGEPYTHLKLCGSLIIILGVIMVNWK